MTGVHFHCPPVCQSELVHLRSPDRRLSSTTLCGSATDAADVVRGATRRHRSLARYQLLACLI